MHMTFAKQRLISHHIRNSASIYEPKQNKDLVVRMQKLLWLLGLGKTTRQLGKHFCTTLDCPSHEAQPPRHANVADPGRWTEPRWDVAHSPRISVASSHRNLRETPLSNPVVEEKMNRNRNPCRSYIVVFGRISGLCLTHEAKHKYLKAPINSPRISLNPARCEKPAQRSGGYWRVDQNKHTVVLFLLFVHQKWKKLKLLNVTKRLEHVSWTETI